MKPALWLGLPILLATACTGEITLPGAGDDPSGPGSGAPGSNASGGSGGSSGASSTGGSGTASVDDVVGVDPETLPDGVPANSRVLRLSYSEYDRTVSDLLGISIEASANFPEEQPNLGPFEGYAARSVNERLLNELVRTAESAAEALVANATAYAALVGCDPSAAGCRDQFIDAFGLRAFRRPLSGSEQERYRALFDSAAELLQSGDAFRDGVQLVVEAILQSPKFVYRIETGSGASDAAGALLSDYEVATRLSYMFWGTLPDATLFAEAAAGTLAAQETLAAQAARLVNDARFNARALEFHERWMQLDELKSLTKDGATYPEFSPGLVESMRAEARRFIEEVTLVQGGTIASLLSAPFGYADANLAGLYGLTGSFGTELTRVEHDPSSSRRGLFTQAAFLSGHSSSSSGTSPILRGVFLLRRVACMDIPDPPAGAQMQEPDSPPVEEIQTTRQYFTWKTSMTACAGCHQAINPAGFAFEQFDGIGRYRTTENGAAIDSTGTLTVDDTAIEFAGARELLDALAGEERVRACYAKHWLEYAYGRAQAEPDLRAVGLSARDLATDGYTLRDLAVALTQRPAFTHLPNLEQL